MTIHAREDEAAPDSDFEWVNAWAAAATVRGALVAAVDGPAELASAIHSGPAGVARVVSSAPAASSPEAIAVAPEAGSDRPDAEQTRSAAVPLFETARRRKRWTHLFRIIARESETEGPAGGELLSMLEASQDASSVRRTQDATEGNGAPMLDLSQIEHDIAEIEAVRDRLLSEFAPASRRSPLADRFASARTSDYVPVLVGGVLALTSLVVFGAAAAFVSLR
jgi:hypothetical protein